MFAQQEGETMVSAETNSIGSSIATVSSAILIPSQSHQQLVVTGTTASQPEVLPQQHLPAPNENTASQCVATVNNRTLTAPINHGRGRRQMTRGRQRSLSAAEQAITEMKKTYRCERKLRRALSLLEFLKLQREALLAETLIRKAFSEQAYWDQRCADEYARARELPLPGPSRITNPDIPQDPVLGQTFGEWFAIQVVGSDSDRKIFILALQDKDPLKCFRAESTGIRIIIDANLKH